MNSNSLKLEMRNKAYEKNKQNIKKNQFLKLKLYSIIQNHPLSHKSQEFSFEIVVNKDQPLKSSK